MKQSWATVSIPESVKVYGTRFYPRLADNGAILPTHHEQFDAAFAACPLIAILRGIKPDEAEAIGEAIDLRHAMGLLLAVAAIVLILG